MGWRSSALLGALLLLGLILIIAGFQGSMGVLLACVFVPDQVHDAPNLTTDLNAVNGVIGSTGNTTGGG